MMGVWSTAGPVVVCIAMTSRAEPRYSYVTNRPSGVRDATHAPSRVPGGVPGVDAPFDRVRKPLTRAAEVPPHSRGVRPKVAAVGQVPRWPAEAGTEEAGRSQHVQPG